MWRFLPDVDPTTPEVYTEVQNLLPTPIRTYRSGGKASVNDAGSFTGSACTGAAVVAKVDGTARIFAGHSTALFELSGGTYTDRSKGGGYTASGSVGWQFGQYGDVTIAVNYADAPQASSSGAFADLAGTPPKAKFIVVQSGAVMLLGYNDGTAYLDGWWASDIGDHTTWTPASSNQAAYGRLLQTPGPITAAIAYRDGVLAAKNSSLYFGRYVGRPLIWAWQVMHPNIGAVTMDTDGQSVFMVGHQGAYIFDGSNVTRVDEGAESLVNGDYYGGNAPPTRVVWLPYERVFACYYGVAAAPFACYSPVSGLWGYGSSDSHGLSDVTAYTPVIVSPAATTYAQLRGMIVSYNVGGTITNRFYTYKIFASGGVQSYAQTGWIGNDRKMTNIIRVIPTFSPKYYSDSAHNYDNGATAARLTYSTAAKRGATMAAVTGSPFSIDTARGRFDVNITARWHQLKVDDGATPGGMELAGLDIVPSGTGGTD